MAKHMVKCAVCGEQFDLNSEQGVKHGARRYAHQKCFPEGEIVPMEVKDPEDIELKELKDYINKLLGEKANWVLITKQIKSYKEKEYTYSGMLKTLQYFYEIKHNKLDENTNGIGIIPFCYQECLNYHYAIWLANKKNSDNNFKIQEEIIHIPVPKKKKLLSSKFKFLDEEVVNGK